MSSSQTVKKVKLKCLPQFKGFIEKARYKVALGGRGRGASTSAAICLVSFASKFRIKVVCARQYMNSIADSSKAQIEEIIYKSGTEADWDITDKYIQHKHTKAIFLFKGLERSTLSIKSMPDIDILFIEEAEATSQEAIDIVFPTIRKKGSEIWIVGNNRLASDPISKFFLGEHPPENMIKISATYLENPHCSDEFLADAERMKLSDPIKYRHIYLGEFVDQASMRLIKNIHIEQGHHNHGLNDWVVIGIDIAGDGGDKTVFAVRKGARIIDLLEFDTMDLDLLIQQTNLLIHRYEPHRVNIDSTGFGALAPQALRREGINIHGVNFSEGSDNPAYSNRRTEMYALVQEWMEQGGALPNDGQLHQDLSQSVYTYDRHNKYQMIPKKEIKAIIGRSPDKGDAVALTMVGCGKDLITAPDKRVIKLERKVSIDQLISSSRFA